MLQYVVKILKLYTSTDLPTRIVPLLALESVVNDVIHDLAMEKDVGVCVRYQPLGVGSYKPLRVISGGNGING